MSVHIYKYGLQWLYGRSVSAGINARFCAYCAHFSGIHSHNYITEWHNIHTNNGRTIINEFRFPMYPLLIIFQWARRGFICFSIRIFSIFFRVQALSYAKYSWARKHIPDIPSMPRNSDILQKSCVQCTKYFKILILLIPKLISPL